MVVKRRKDDRDIELVLIKLDALKDDIGEVKSNVKDLKIEVKDCYVSKIEFDPIKKLVYGAVSLILVAVIGAIIALVVRT